MNATGLLPAALDYAAGLGAGPGYATSSAAANWTSLDWNSTADWNRTELGGGGAGWQEIARERSALAVLLLLFSVATVFGNALVVAAVVRERYLHTATNYFVTSLAVADCLVGFVVMPFSAVYEVVENQWLFGTDWCDVWRSLDVLFSTASILNLCVISLDRYWAITDPFTYPTKMTRRRALYLIAAVWAASGAISFPAIVWWRAARSEEVPPLKCPFTDSLTYLLFSSTISFYLPLFVMVFTYYRIYRAAVIQTRSLKLGSKQVMMASGELELTLRIHRGGTGSSGGSSGGAAGGGGGGEPPPQQQRPSQSHAYQSSTSTPEEPLADIEDPLTPSPHNGLSRHGGGGGGSGSAGHSKNLGKNFSISRKLAKFAKEKKAAKTLGIVMGVFIVCWLPFFVVNLLSGFCPACIVNEQLVSAIVTWLGWINSGMNPVIYACWSRDFRRAFARILCACCPRKMRRKYQPTLRCKSTRAYPSRSEHRLEPCPCARAARAARAEACGRSGRALRADPRLSPHRDTLAPLAPVTSHRHSKRVHKYLNAAVMLTPTGVTYAAVSQADLYSRWRRGRGGRGYPHSATGGAITAAAQALAGQKVPVPLPARSPDDHDPDLYDDLDDT